MSISIEALSSALGAKVAGFDPKGVNISEADRDLLVKAWLDYGVLLLRDLQLEPTTHIELTRVFGEPEIHPVESIRHKSYPEIIVLSTGLKQVTGSDPEADRIAGQIPWHSDLTYTTAPSRGALLYAVEVPEEGGLTAFIDTAKVYDELSEAMKKKIEGVEAIHTFESAHKQAKQQGVTADKDGIQLPDFPEVIQPLVLEQPETGRKALNISPSFISRVIGLPESASQQLLAELIAFATQERFIYVHSWHVGDLIIWDNFRTLHSARGTKRKYRRLMHRTTIKATHDTGRLTA